MTDWTLNGEVLDEAPQGMCGFVYRITRVEDGKFYIGKKIFSNRVTKPPLKGKTRKRRSVKESDWKSYYGSSEELKADVVLLGCGAFQREILHLCESKSKLSYWETYEIMVNHCLTDPNSYNKWLSARIQANTL